MCKNFFLLVGSNFSPGFANEQQSSLFSVVLSCPWGTASSSPPLVPSPVCCFLLPPVRAWMCLSSAPGKTALHASHSDSCLYYIPDPRDSDCQYRRGGISRVTPIISFIFQETLGFLHFGVGDRGVLVSSAQK